MGMGSLKACARPVSLKGATRGHCFELAALPLIPKGTLREIENLKGKPKQK